MTESLEVFNDDDLHRVLCVVAHPDDMEYGGSAAVAQWSARGIEVSYLLLSAGEAGIRTMDPTEVAPLRKREQQRACDIVGAHELTILDFPDGLIAADHATRKAIASEIRRVKPQAVFIIPWQLTVGWGFNHVDHRNTGLATIDAIRDADNPWIFPELKAAGLMPWKADWLLVSGAEPNAVIALSEESVEKSIASLEAHEVYLRELSDHPAPRDMITQITQSGGQAIGQAYGLGVHATRM